MTDGIILLPSNSTPVELSIDRAISRSIDLDVPIVANTRPEEASVDHLPFLAWALSVDSWDSSWSSDVKREAILRSVSIHRRKGTVAAIRSVLKALGYGTAEIVEASRAPLLDGGQSLDEGHRLHDLTHWASYSVFLDQPIRAYDASRLASVLEKAAPARCHLQSIQARVSIALDEGHVLDEGWSLDTTFLFEVN